MLCGDASCGEAAAAGGGIRAPASSVQEVASERRASNIAWLEGWSGG